MKNRTSRVLRIELPANRDFTGTIALLDGAGSCLAGPFAACARTGDQLAESHGNPSRATTLPYGDTPLGTYRVVAFIPTGAGTKYRRELFGTRGALVLRAMRGDAALAEANGRFEILIHGGPPSQDGRLRATSGGVRVSDADLTALARAAAPIHDLTCDCVTARPALGSVEVERDFVGEAPASPPSPDWITPSPRLALVPELVAQGEYSPAPTSGTAPPPAGDTDDDDVDVGFISKLEGGQQTDGYVPDADTSKSGVTVATGVDIGQLSADQIDKMDIPDDLKDKLKDYAGLTGQAAVDYLDAHPLEITPEEATSLDRVVYGQTISAVSGSYDDAHPGNAFTSLPADAQTVIASVATQYGTDLETRTPNFWSAVTEGRWQDAVNELRDFGDNYQSRHNQEADLLQSAITSGELSAVPPPPPPH